MTIRAEDATTTKFELQPLETDTTIYEFANANFLVLMWVVVMKI